MFRCQKDWEGALVGKGRSTVLERNVGSATFQVSWESLFIS